MLQGIGRIIRSKPSVVIIPFLLMALIIGLGVWGVVAAAQDQEDRYREDATKAASDLSAGIVAAVRSSYKPAAMLGQFIAMVRLASTDTPSQLPTGGRIPRYARAHLHGPASPHHHYHSGV